MTRPPDAGRPSDAGRHRGRGWVAVLAALVVVTAGCVVGYLAAPFDPSPVERTERTGPAVVPAEHRIVAVTRDGSLVVLDARDGSLSETIVPAGMADVAHLEVGAHHETAYVGRRGGDGSGGPVIDLVRLGTGEGETVAHGRIPAVGPVSFPQLDVNVGRPDLEQLAYVTVRDGAEVIAVENLVTGARTTIGPRSTGRASTGTVSTGTVSGDQRLGSIEDLAWSPSDNRLFGIADGGRVLFWIDTDRARSLDEAVVSDPLPDGARWLDASSFGDGLAVIRESTGGETEIVEVGRRRLEPTGRSWSVPSSVRLESVDANEAGATVLATTDDGDLLRFSAAADRGPLRLSRGLSFGIELAAR